MLLVHDRQIGEKTFKCSTIWRLSLPNFSELINKPIIYRQLAKHITYLYLTLHTRQSHLSNIFIAFLIQLLFALSIFPVFPFWYHICAASSDERCNSSRNQNNSNYLRTALDTCWFVYGIAFAQGEHSYSTFFV